MSINRSYIPSDSEVSLASSVNEIIQQAGNNNNHFNNNIISNNNGQDQPPGRYQSLGTTNCLVEMGGVDTISQKVDLERVSKEPGDEGMMLTFLQVVGPFFVAGMGSMGTGLLLDLVRTWDNFQNIDSLITLVPTLLGLKGNLEMTVTARLCTASNMGYLDDRSELLRFLRDDLMLTQFQATIVSLMASLLTLIIQYLREPAQVTWSHSVIVVSSSVVTAAFACLFLGCLMTLVVYLSRKLKINPDNVCAPLAASLGDISTLGIFAYTSLAMYSMQAHLWIPISLAILLMCLCPIWGTLAYRSPEVKSHLNHGWLPIFIAMSISLGAGYILDVATKDIPAAAAFVPVVSGICGNLLVILVCRMTTHLRRQAPLGCGKETIDDIRKDHPLKCGGKPSSLKSTFRVLASLPFSHVIFSFIITYFTVDVTATWTFMGVFLLLVFIHGILMLLFTRETVLRLWLWGIDPDVASIPILTAVADLTGGAFTCMIFIILLRINDSSVTSPGILIGHTELITATPFNATIAY